MKTIEERLKQIINEQQDIDIETIKPESLFVEDFRCDSLDTVEIVMAIEEEFSIGLDDEETEEKMDKIRTFGEALEFLTRILKPPNEKLCREAGQKDKR